MGSVEPFEFENLQVERNSFRHKKDIFLRDSKLNEIIEKTVEVFIGYMPIKCNMAPKMVVLRGPARKNIRTYRLKFLTRPMVILYLDIHVL